MLQTELTFDIQFTLVIACLKGAEMNLQRDVLLRFDQVFLFVQTKWRSRMMIGGCGTRIRDQIPFVDIHR